MLHSPILSRSTPRTVRTTHSIYMTSPHNRKDQAVWCTSIFYTTTWSIVDVGWPGSHPTGRCIRVASESAVGSLFLPQSHLVCAHVVFEGRDHVCPFFWSRPVETHDRRVCMGIKRKSSVRYWLLVCERALKSLSPGPGTPYGQFWVLKVLGHL